VGVFAVAVAREFRARLSVGVFVSGFWFRQGTASAAEGMLQFLREFAQLIRRTV
jgi:hypothetical protein